MLKRSPKKVQGFTILFNPKTVFEVIGDSKVILYKKGNQGAQVFDGKFAQIFILLYLKRKISLAELVENLNATSGSKTQPELQTLQFLTNLKKIGVLRLD